MRKRLSALALITAGLWLIVAAARAHADIGGTIPGPGLCDYPGVGVSVVVDPVVGQGLAYFCRFPQEINGSYWIQGYGLYATSGNMSGGMLGVNLGVGGGGGLTGYFCLDNPYHPTVFKRSSDPNPPGAWKNRIEPARCEPLDEQVIEIPGVPPPAPDQFPTGAPTNPALPNPEQTQNPDHR